MCCCHSSSGFFTFTYHFRNSLGSNDNPNAIEFKSAFRKLLICHPATTSVDHNVISNATGILTVSSAAKKKLSPLPNLNQEFELQLEFCYEDIMLKEIETMDRYDEHMCAYIALTVEEKFHQNVRQHKYKCAGCSAVLYTSDNKINDELLAMKAESKQPSISAFKLVIFANAVMNMFSMEHGQGNSFNAVRQTIYERLDIDDIFENFYHVQHDENTFQHTNHKEEFVFELIKTYMTIKSHKIGEKVTIEEQGELIRRKRKRAVILAGQ